MLVIEQVGEQDLELANRAVTAGQRALEWLDALAGGGHRDALRETVAVGRQREAVEALSHQIIGDIAQYALDRRTLIAHCRVGLQHDDEVARVAHERSEARLAAAAMDLLAEHGAVESQCDLRGQGAHGGALGVGGLGGRGHQQCRGLRAARSQRDDVHVRMRGRETGGERLRDVEHDHRIRQGDRRAPPQGHRAGGRTSAGRGQRAAGRRPPRGTTRLPPRAWPAPPRPRRRPGRSGPARWRRRVRRLRR